MTRLFRVMAEKDRKNVMPVTGSRNRTSIILLSVLLAVAVMPGAAMAAQVIDGKALVMERSKGNCLACHAIADGKLPGNIGPPLIAMKARFPDAESLHKQIWDATTGNPDTRMPPFGRHGILSREEIDLIVKYLYTL